MVMTNTPFQLTTTHLRIDLRARTSLAFEQQPGQQLRGALFGAMRRHYCPAPNDPTPGHSDACPVCWLLTREDDDWWRGRTPARPYTIVPPLPDRPDQQRAISFQAGAPFSFGITLVGPAVNLFPYLVLALPEMGRVGVGRRLPENGGQRGRFTLMTLRCIHPLTGKEQMLLAKGDEMVQMPSLAVTGDQVAEAAMQLVEEIDHTLRLRFLTPTRIVTGGRLLHRPQFRPLFGRLVDRVEGLAREYGCWGEIDVKPALTAAEQVELVEDGTVWMDLPSHSSRTRRALPAGGFVGQATYTAPDWEPLLPWLLWGTLVHVGKNAVKGEGMFTLDEVSAVL